jgi:hypothetical protein
MSSTRKTLDTISCVHREQVVSTSIKPKMHAGLFISQLIWASSFRTSEYSSRIDAVLWRYWSNASLSSSIEKIWMNNLRGGKYRSVQAIAAKRSGHIITLRIELAIIQRGWLYLVYKRWWPAIIYSSSSMNIRTKCTSLNYRSWLISSKPDHWGWNCLWICYFSMYVKERSSFIRECNRTINTAVDVRAIETRIVEDLTRCPPGCSVDIPRRP